MAAGLEDELAVAMRLADAADEVTLAAFTGAAVAHEIKADGSPVSAADLAVERRISEILAVERPADGVLGEEVGESGPAGRRWIVDGIDGTVLFVAGVRGWATEIALEVDGEVVVGVCTVQPAPAGGGGGGRRGGSGPGGGATPPVRAASRSGSPARPTWPPGRGPPSRRSTPSTATGAGLVERLGAAGASYVAPARARCAARGRRPGRRVRADRGGPWDFAALAVIVTEAGGRFADLTGRPDIYGGGPVAVLERPRA